MTAIITGNADVLAGLAEADRDLYMSGKQGFPNADVKVHESESLDDAYDAVHEGLVFPTEEEKLTLTFCSVRY